MKVEIKPVIKRNIMKTKIGLFCATLIVAAAVGLKADEPVNAPAKAASPEFERMKALVGTWNGKADMGQGPIDMTISFRLLAGGSVLEERAFSGTPNEMITMYYDQDGKLAMTHYCMLGNRPSMVLKSANTKTIQFDFDKNCGINTDKESHMHAMSITFDNANTITTTCKAFIDGKEMPDNAVVLKRVKS
jgi:hypothetical protein